MNFLANLILFALAKLEQMSTIYIRFFVRLFFYSNNSYTKVCGVGIYVANSFYCQEITNLRINLSGCENVWIEVVLNDETTLVVGTVYRHPQPNNLQFSQALCSNLLRLKANKRFVVLGDFNIDYGHYSTRLLKCLQTELPVLVANN